jgi:hypothetical protein
MFASFYFIIRNTNFTILKTTYNYFNLVMNFLPHLDNTYDNLFAFAITWLLFVILKHCIKSDIL